jgi:amidase
VEEAEPDADLRGILESWRVTWFAAAHLDVDLATPFLAGRQLADDDLEPLSRAIAASGRTLSVLDYQMAAIKRHTEARAIGRFHETFHVWLTPTLAWPPVPIGAYTGAATDADAFWSEFLEYMPYTPIQNATGQPSISLPLHWNAERLPIGTLFTSALGEEAKLLRLAAQLEQAKPWIDRKPPVWG